MTPPIPYKLIASLVGGLLALGALTWLIGSRSHWQKTAAANEQLYHGEQAAHQLTVSNYRIKAEEARKADSANVARVVLEQHAVNERSSSEYQARIADARARAASLQRQADQARANSGRGGVAPVSTVRVASSVLNDPTTKDRLSGGDALVATEQAIQLDELIKWVRAQVGINTNEHTSK